MKISKRYRQFKQDHQGAALLEFAIAAPVLFLILFAAIELANFVYMDQKLKNATYNVLNIVNDQLNLNEAQLPTIARIVPQVVKPYTLSNSQYKVVITAVRKDVLGAADPYIEWQWPRNGVTTSRFIWDEDGSKEDNAVSPEMLNDYVFTDGDQLLTVEVNIVYRPIFDTLATRSLLGLNNQWLSFFATSRPRPGAYDLSPYGNL